jgi:transposase
MTDRHSSYHRVSQTKRVEAVALQAKGLSIRGIGRKLKLKPCTTQAILSKWKSSHTLDDLPKKGAPRKLDD